MSWDWIALGIIAALGLIWLGCWLWVFDKHDNALEDEHRPKEGQNYNP